MSLRDEEELKAIRQHIDNNASNLKHNEILFNIIEGDLLTAILNDLRNSLSPSSFEQIQARVAPINVLIKIIDKLSKIYSKSPKRMLQKETAGDKSLYDFYFENMNPNVTFNGANEFYNLFKNTFVEPFVEKGKPFIRAIPSHQFLMWSTNEINPLTPTHFIKFMGTFQKRVNKDMTVTVQKIFLYTETEFLIVDSDFEILQDEMNRIGNPEGINPFGTLPGTYINKSKNNLIPTPDSDTLQMTKIIPVLLSDLNFATMFQAFSIIYGIDLDEENMHLSPNAFWRFKSDKNAPEGSRPKIGVLKPEVDIEAVITLIKFQLTFWMQTRNIKPGDIQKAAGGELASGVSKLIDEMDTSEDRQKQVPVFKKAEEEHWLKVRENYHPFWAKNKEIDLLTAFSSNVTVEVEFQEQRPLVKRIETVNEQKTEQDAGYTTRKRAITRLNPELTEKEIDTLILEIDKERVIEIEGEQDGESGKTTGENK